jgi:hypothetical protein
MNTSYTMTLKSGRMIAAKAYQGDKPANWQPAGNHYQIIVEYFIMPGNKKVFRFDFWDSYHNKQNNIPCDIRGALSSWAGDVFTGMNCSSVNDIVSEFGYNKFSEALRVFKGVKRAEKQYTRIEMSEDDLQELSDY